MGAGPRIPDSPWPPRGHKSDNTFPCQAAGGREVVYDNCVALCSAPQRNRVCAGCESPWRICVACVLQRSAAPEIWVVDKDLGLCEFHLKHGTDAVWKLDEKSVRPTVALAPASKSTPARAPVITPPTLESKEPVLAPRSEREPVQEIHETPRVVADEPQQQVSGPIKSSEQVVEVKPTAPHSETQAPRKVRKPGFKKDQHDICDPVDQHVGERLRVRRRLLNISQSDLAIALGLSFQQVQKYEKGKNRVSASKLYFIGKYLNVPPSYFFAGLEQPDFSVEEEDSLLEQVRQEKIRAALDALETAQREVRGLTQLK